MPATKVTSAAVLIALVASRSAGADELRVGFAGQCPISAEHPREAALSAAGVALLADFGGRLVGGLIDQIAGEMAEDKVTSLRGTGRMRGFYTKTPSGDVKLNPAEGCLMIAAGEFGNTSSTLNPFPKRSEPVASEDIRKVVEEFGDIKGSLKFYMEGVFEPSRDQTAFAFMPTYVYYPQFIDKRRFFSSSQRDFLVRIEWSAPGEEAFGTAQLQWSAVGETEQGVVIAEKQQLDGLQTEWARLPQVTALPADSGVFAPTNVRVLVSETAKPHTVAKYFGEALKGQKEQITTATQDAITRSVSTEARLQARLKLSEAAQTANTAYVTAFDDAQEAFETWNREIDPEAKPDRLNAARLAYRRVSTTEQLARRAYADAGLPFEPRPPLKPLP